MWQKDSGTSGGEDFRRDCQFLFEDDDRLGPHLSSTISALGELDENEIAALLKDLPTSDAKYVVAGIRALHEQKNRAPAVALSTALNAMWNAGFCERVLETLMNLEGTRQPLLPATLADRPVFPPEPTAVPTDGLTNEPLYRPRDFFSTTPPK